MVKKLLITAVLLTALKCYAQSTDLAPGNYRHVNVVTNLDNLDYTKALILLHEVYNGTNIGTNYAVGTLTAKRGTTATHDRHNIAEVNTSSAYQSVFGTFSSTDDAGVWQLKTCIFNGKKYIALDVPYRVSGHEAIRFSGWTISTGENMRYVVYERNGQAMNHNVLSNIQDYTANLAQTHYYQRFNIMANVGIGTANPTERLSVNGTIRAKEVKVESANWPDYVFEDNYRLPDLAELEAYIKTNKHLPGIPDKHQVAAEGISLGEMNRLLLEKVEELTLKAIDHEKTIRIQKEGIDSLRLTINKQDHALRSLADEFKELKSKLN